MKSVIKLLPILAISVYASKGSYRSDVQSYLRMNEQFEAWDYMSSIPTLIDNGSNEITADDSLLNEYSNLFSEWDVLTDDSTESSWSAIEDVLNWKNENGNGSLPEWDLRAFLKTTHEARSFNKWTETRTSKEFDISKVRPWNPELAPAVITTSWNQPISPSPNPSLNGYVDFPLNVKVTLYSNRLAITPYRELLKPNREIMSRFISETIKKSFNIRDSDSPDETTKKMNRTLRNDVHVNSHVEYTPFGISGEVGNFGMSVFTDVGITIPGDLLGIVFGSTMEKNSKIDISSLSAQAIAGTVLTAGGRSRRSVPNFMRPLLPTGEGWFWKQFSVDFISGLGLVDLRGLEGSVKIDAEGSSYIMEGEAEVYLAGSGLKGYYEDNGRYATENLQDLRPTGYGVGVDAGFEICDEKRAFQLQFSNVGAMRWKDVQKGRVAIHSDSLDMESIVKGKSDFDANTVNSSLKNDTLTYVESLWRPLNTSFTIAGTQVLSERSKRSVHGLYARQLRVFGEYNQAITRYAGSSFVPRLKLGIEDDFLMGAIGMGYHTVIGGSERIGSGLTIRLFQNRRFSLNTEYLAYGSPILYPKRGVGLAMVTRFNRHPEKWYK